MVDPEKQRCYRQPQAMVEPVFSVLRLKQGLNRFRRRGLRGARRELARHIMAYNLGRALALRPLGALFSALWRWIRRFSGWWRVQLASLDRRPRSIHLALWLSPTVLGGHR